MEGVYVRPHLFMLHLLFIGLFGWSPWEFLNFRPNVSRVPRVSYRVNVCACACTVVALALTSLFVNAQPSLFYIYTQFLWVNAEVTSLLHHWSLMQQWCRELTSLLHQPTYNNDDVIVQRVGGFTQREECSSLIMSYNIIYFIFRATSHTLN